MPNPLLTVIIPIGPYHQDVAQRAIDSVKAQTLPCEYIAINDIEGRGAGFARNRGLEHVNSLYITFLDADDVIDPRFAEFTVGILEQYAESHTDPRYVYTDWLGVNNASHKAPDPCEAWTNKTFHLVTAVLPTSAVRRIGGFDEVMQGAEDADFYVRLRLSGVCGIHVNAPLVSYREGGQRSITARANGQEALSLNYMTQRYGGYKLMGCCGDSTPGPITPQNEPQDGDVLAQASYSGNRVVRGLATGRLYPRVSYPKMLYMSPRDIEAAPTMWRAVQTPMQAQSGIVLQPQYKSAGTWQEMSKAIFGGGELTPAAQPVEYKPNVPGRSKKDVIAKAQETTQQWTKVNPGELE